MSTTTTTRADRLLARLEEAELDAILVTNLVNVRYLTGFTGSNGYALLGRDGARLRLGLPLRRAGGRGRSTAGISSRAPAICWTASRICSAPRISGSGTRTARCRSASSIPWGGSSPRASSWPRPGRWSRRSGRSRTRRSSPVIRAAAELADDALRELLEGGLAGRTEAEVALALEFAQRRRGAEDVSFRPIVAAGAHGALPHAQPQDSAIPRDVLVVLDWGARLDGYCSDCTRTVATGEGVAGEAREVYELVRSAQLAGLGAVRAGAEAAAVDGAARAPIEAAGHGERFGHGLGHGVGLDVHEAPRLGKGSESVLEAGNVVSVEPGVYLPGAFGVRIEDLVAVTAEGADVFTGLPKDLTVVG